MALTKPPVLPPWAEAGDKVQPTNAEIQTGWPLSNTPPARQRWNWILNFLANGVRYLTRRGLSDYGADETYMVGDRVIGDDGNTYRSIQDNNINHAPSASPLWWEEWAPSLSRLADLLQKQTYTAFTTAGAAPNFTLTPAPAITAYSAGQRFRVKFHAAGNGADVLNISGLGNKSLKQYDSTGAKVAAVVAANQLTDVEFDGVDMVIIDALPASISLDKAFRKNLVVDGACRMAQLAAKNISTAAQYGAVDMFAAWASGTAVTAGTISQSSAAPVGAEGFSLHLSGVTVTGAGVVYARHRIESAIARRLKNKTASFSVMVYHDVGAAVNYTAVIRKANAVDNFSGVTVIGTSAAQAIQSATGTLLKFENVAMGDCSNGIEIEVQAACGAVVTKNFHFAEWQLEEGVSATPFDWPSITNNIDNVRRYLEKTYDIETLPGSVTFLGAFVGDTSGVNDLSCPFRVDKRAIPSITYYSALSGASGVVAYKNTMTVGPQGDIGVEASYLSKGMLSVQTNPGDNFMPIIHFVADCRL
jgi:hypothetical protein